MQRYLKRIVYYFRGVFQHTAIILILGISFFLRIVVFDYPVMNGEAQRDYIVGRHIAQFGEFPLTGPCCLFNAEFGFVRNSPLYYYLIAAIVKLNDSILFLGLVNIIFQVATVGMVYILAKSLFGKGTAIIASIIFSLSFAVFRQSFFAWQPHLMSTFVHASYLLLLSSYLTRRYSLLLLSIFIFIFAAALHNPPYAIAPTFAVLVFLILKAQKQPIGSYFIAGVTAAGSFITLYLPWILYGIAHQLFLPRGDGREGRLLVMSFQELLNQFLATGEAISSGFFIHWVVLPFFLLGCVVYLFFQKEGSRLRFFLILLIASAQFVAFASLFNSTIWTYYFTPIFGIFTLLLAEIINGLFTKNTMTLVLKVIIVIILIKIFSFDLFPLRNRSFLTMAKQMDEIVSTMTSQGIDINSFRIKVYATGVESPKAAHLVFWAPLEKALDRKLIRITDEGLLGLEFLTSDEHVFVICQSYRWHIDVEGECLGPFFSEYQDYSLIEQIYTDQPFSIFLTKKMDK